MIHRYRVCNLASIKSFFLSLRTKLFWTLAICALFNSQFRPLCLYMHVLEPSWSRFWEKIILSWRMLTRPIGWANWHAYKRITITPSQKSWQKNQERRKQVSLDFYLENTVRKSKRHRPNVHHVHCYWTRNMLIGFGRFCSEFACTLQSEFVRRHPIWKRWLWMDWKILI